MKNWALGLFLLSSCQSSFDKLSLPLPSDAKPPGGKLSRDVVPEKYDLELELEPAAARFSGKVGIEVTLGTSVDSFWIHGQGLHVSAAQLVMDGKQLDAGYREAEGGVALVRLERAVGPGKARLELTYDAPYLEQLEGLYKVKVGAEDYLFSQLEAVAARQVFPGFDEPAWKTPYDIVLEIPEGLTAITATLPVKEEVHGKQKRVTFATTAPLPTYLLSFSVGRFDIIEAPPLPPRGERTKPLVVRGVAVEGRGKEMVYALAQTPRIVDAIEQKLGVAYPYDKLDIIAVPDFSAGAMENVGAITFRDSLLLFDPATAPANARRKFASVMAHELGHQWFGNLVTMPWWDDLWLNEAFATWIETPIVATLYPELGAELDAVKDSHDVMRQDALTAARRIREPILSNHDINNAFDDITYSKGGAIIAMFERYVGREKLQKGLEAYLRRYAGKTATFEQLLETLKESTGQDLTASWMSFLSQAGVPRLDVVPRCKGNKGELGLHQERFLPVGSRGNKDVGWQVPVCVRYGYGANGVGETCTLLTEREAVVPLPIKGCATWVMPNAAGAGYYRWTLPAADFATLEQRGTLSLPETLSMADNLLAAVSAGTLQARDALPRLAGLAASSERRVAAMPMTLIEEVRDDLLEPEQLPQLEAYAQKIYRPVLLKLSGKTTASEEELLFSNDVLSFLADVARDPDVRAQLTQQAHQYVGDGSSLDKGAMEATFVSTALAVAAQQGGPELFEAMLKALKGTEDNTLRRQLLRGLGSFLSPLLQDRARGLTTDGTLRVMETWTLLYTQAEDAETRQPLWQWFTQNFDAVLKRVPSDYSGSLPWIAHGYCSEAKAKEIEAFFGPRIDSLPGGPRNLAEVVEAIELCAARAAVHRDGARAFFAGKGGSEE